MTDTVSKPAASRWFVPSDALQPLVDALTSDGYTVIAPIVHEGTILMRTVTSADDIAAYVRDNQQPGQYRVQPNDDGTPFEYVLGPDGPKRYFFPPEQRLFSLHVEGERLVFDEMGDKPPKLAFIGVRACELAAIAMQDRVFGVEETQATFRCESETFYGQTRRNSLIIAINCTRPGGTCFCESWGTGPEVSEGYDLAMTPLRSGFVARVGSERGLAILQQLDSRAPNSAELELETMKLEQARHRMGRSIDVDIVKPLLDRAIDHPHWDELAKRCLSCGNCTLVCPTCFCSTVTDDNDLAGDRATRTRRWESCFTHQFSYTTPGPVRSSIRSRYRHWLRHKLSTWWDQFGTSGCVGCGRCITWCPVGIDLTREVKVIRGELDSKTPSDAQVQHEVTP